MVETGIASNASGAALGHPNMIGGTRVDDSGLKITRVARHGGPERAPAGLPDGIELPLIDHSRARVHSAERTYVATEDFSWRDADGDLQHFKEGKSWCSAEAAALAENPEKFAEDGSREALRARGYKPGMKERVKARAGRTKQATAAPIATVRRSAGSPTPPWKIENRAPEKTPAAPQIRRPRAVTGDAIFDLSTVRFSILDPAPAARDLRDRAMRAVERARYPHARADQDAIRGHLAELIDGFEPDDYQLTEHLMRTGSPAHRTLFAKYMRGKFMTDDQLRALSLTDFSTGLAAVPFNLDPTIIPTSSRAINPLRSISRGETSMTDRWQGVGSAGIAARYRGEGEEAEDNSPNLARLEVDTESADAWVPFSFEIGADWGGMEPQIAALLQRGKDELEADKFRVGSGEGEPLGLLTALAGKTIETITAGTLALGDIEALEEALASGFLDQAHWLGHREAFKVVRGFDTKGAAPIWVKHPGRVPELNGIAALELSTMDDEIEDGAKPLVLGDFSNFVIVDRIGTTIRRIPHVFKNGRPTGKSGFYSYWRNGTTLATEDAFRVLEIKEDE